MQEMINELKNVLVIIYLIIFSQNNQKKLKRFHYKVKMIQKALKFIQKIQVKNLEKMLIHCHLKPK